jgi:hypothetical protein
VSRPVVLLASVVFLAGFAPAAGAAPIVYTALLTGPNESPPNASPGTGFATVTFDPFANTMRVQVTFSGLTSGTTASHIHATTALAFTGTAGVATTTPTFPGFPLGVTSGSYDQTFDMALASSYNPAFVTANGGSVLAAEAALFSAINSGRAYLNIHTSQFPGGEIRGFLVSNAIPEPASIAVLGVLATGLGVAARRRTARA